VSRALRETSLAGQQTYPDFASYFEARTGKPFAVWCELEATYTFVASYRPELLTQLYQVAQKALCESTPKVHANGGDRRSEQFQPDNSQAETYGNGSRYRITRLKCDRPDIADALARGEYPSVRGSPLKFPPPRSTEIRRYAPFPP
jgi:hypothetical protein